MTWHIPYFSLIRRIFILTTGGLRPGAGLLGLVALALLFQPGLVGHAAEPVSIVDPTFMSGSGANNLVRSIVVQSDGKILIGGDFITWNGTAGSRIARLNADGNSDTSFNAGGSGADGDVYSIALQNDGKILIGGRFYNYNGVARSSIARLNTDGSLDTSFIVDRYDNSSTAHSIAVQNDGKILIGGNFMSYNGPPRHYLVRLNADGSVDTTFNAGGTGAYGVVHSIVVQGDGKILIGGNLSSYNGTARGHIARLNSDGGLDTTFNAGGAGAYGDVYSIVVQSDGKILIGGEFTRYNDTATSRVVRLNADGNLDTSFNAGETGFYGTVLSLAVQNEGKILIGGYFTGYKYLARLNAGGSLDTAFNAGGVSVNNGVRSIAVQSDGKILIGGIFTAYNGMGRNRIARLNSNGSLDTAFNAGGTGADDIVKIIAV